MQNSFIFWPYFQSIAYSKADLHQVQWVQCQVGYDPAAHVSHQVLIPTWQNTVLQAADWPWPVMGSGLVGTTAPSDADFGREVVAATVATVEEDQGQERRTMKFL
ncbi:hypothetical protein HispidOSU_003167 [Sigmodon hispidus]